VVVVRYTIRYTTGSGRVEHVRNHYCKSIFESMVAWSNQTDRAGTVLFHGTATEVMGWEK
jgi:hypothetical protein